MTFANSRRKIDRGSKRDSRSRRVAKVSSRDSKVTFSNVAEDRERFKEGYVRGKGPAGHQIQLCFPHLS